MDRGGPAPSWCGHNCWVARKGRQGALQVYRTAHSRLLWLPTKLAGWIGENLQEELGFPDKADKRAQPGAGWTPAEFNHILQDHVVDGALTTFGCVEWESDLFRGVMRARCYPFDMPKRRFHAFNPKVCNTYFQISYQYIPMLSRYILLQTGIYPYILVDTMIYCISVCRTPWLLFLLILTASRRIIVMSPWKTVGMHTHSSSSHASCVQKMDDCLRMETTETVQMTSCTTSYSSTPLRSSSCQSRGQWRTLG